MTAMIFNESGKGYWMEGFGCLRAEGENRPSRPNHVVILSPLDSQDIQIVDGNWKDINNNIAINDGTTFNLMAMHGHDVHVVCYEVNDG